ncbi:MAG: acyl carrier protein [Gammaproteobacteria bacterium]|nr:acyl carrier protein [Gammaproteobacteria bacterium]
MPDQQILDDLTQILRDLLFDDSLVLLESTTRADIPAWDSFSYVNFIVAVEMRFGIKFGVAEVESFVTVGEIATRIEQLTDAV